MAELYKIELGRLVGGLEHDKYLVVSGRVQAMEEMYNLIDNLLAQAGVIDEHKRTATATVERIKSHRDLTFAGSRWWEFLDRSKQP